MRHLLVWILARVAPWRQVSLSITVRLRLQLDQAGEHDAGERAQGFQHRVGHGVVNADESDGFDATPEAKAAGGAAFFAPAEREGGDVDVVAAQQGPDLPNDAGDVAVAEKDEAAFEGGPGFNLFPPRT